MSWAYTSSGPFRYNGWNCFSCGQKSEALGLQATREDVRADAASHVQKHGHTVEFTSGTREQLDPLATSAVIRG